MKTLENLIMDCINAHGNKFTYNKITSYKNNRTKFIVTCPVEGHGDFLINYYCFINKKQGCPKCAHIQRYLTKIENKSKKYYDLIKNSNTKLFTYEKFIYIGEGKKSIVTCIKPEHGDFLVTPYNHFFNNSGCPKCKVDNMKKRSKYTTEEIKQLFKEINNDEYDYINVIYKGINNKVKIICKTHGEFLQTPHSHLNGSGCPKCKRSRGEELIEKYLQEHNIKFETQKRFKGCKGKKHQLPFDFYLSDYNILIEFDGKQHFKSIKFYGGSDAFIRRQLYDNIKNQYCENNGIKLIRIPYNEIKNITKILDTSINLTV